MAMNTLTCSNLSQAYSGESWEYGEYGVAYAGYAGGNLYAVTILRFDIPEFTGVSEALEVKMAMGIGVGATAKLRWALCTSDANRSLYMQTAEAVADDNQVDSGIVTLDGMTDTVEVRGFSLPTTKLQAGTWYLMLWAAGDTGVSIKAVQNPYGNHSMELGYNMGAVRIETASGVKLAAVYGGKKRQLIPYAKTADGVKPCS